MGEGCEFRFEHHRHRHLARRETRDFSSARAGESRQSHSEHGATLQPSTDQTDRRDATEWRRCTIGRQPAQTPNHAGFNHILLSSTIPQCSPSHHCILVHHRPSNAGVCSRTRITTSYRHWIGLRDAGLSFSLPPRPSHLIRPSLATDHPSIHSQY